MATMWGTSGARWIKLLFGVKITQRISRPLATVRRNLILFHDAGCPQVPDMKITSVQVGGSSRFHASFSPCSWYEGNVVSAVIR